MAEHADAALRVQLTAVQRASVAGDFCGCNLSIPANATAETAELQKSVSANVRGAWRTVANCRISLQQLQQLQNFGPRIVR